MTPVLLREGSKIVAGADAAKAWLSHHLRIERLATSGDTQMAYAGQVIENPVSGERITFRKTAADTNGELLEIDLELAPDGHVPGMHVHPTQTERFEIVSG